jgi:hypothetical protein
MPLLRGGHDHPACLAAARAGAVLLAVVASSADGDLASTIRTVEESLIGRHYLARADFFFDAREK